MDRMMYEESGGGRSCSEFEIFEIPALFFFLAKFSKTTKLLIQDKRSGGRDSYPD
jgi:hypothetical protein